MQDMFASTKVITAAMEINILIFTNLLAYSIIVSQSFTYIIALRNVQLNLRAECYIECRNLLNRNYLKKFAPVVYCTHITAVLLLVLCSAQPTGLLFITTGIAWIALLLDSLFTIKGNIPINKTIQSWTEKSYPADWEKYRNRWLAIFLKRQVANITGFISLLTGAVFG